MGEGAWLFYDTHVEVRRQLTEFSYLIPPCVSSGLEASHQFWWQASLPNEPFLWSQLIALLMNVGLKILFKETHWHLEDPHDLVKWVFSKSPRHHVSAGKARPPWICHCYIVFSVWKECKTSHSAKFGYGFSVCPRGSCFRNLCLTALIRHRTPAMMLSLAVDL